MSMDGFRADPEELRGGASDIQECLNSTKGADFGALNRSVEEFGNLIVSGKFEKFCDTWDVACEVLQGRATDLADELKRTADNYERSDAEAEQLVSPSRAGQ
ncbi:Excreted virulence factor EspC, type VII ESX diderm [Streptomyces sp. cf386]|uniref:type VII secretion target n=1 Tax=Streptomyces sp. cf386 TaxID=1761904 RepID=UPI0008922D17|nr:type VII secretion target [Streptomyces sp. cf386]SDN12049.1 Excreted virulence factor EspC, type VII ESX diderm [Streptomyces sp. cf386]